MSMDDIRKKYEKDSPAAKSFRKPATRRKLFAYLALSVVSIGLAIYLFASTGNGIGAIALASAGEQVNSAVPDRQQTNPGNIE